jgi:hypothetical protein
VSMINSLVLSSGQPSTALTVNWLNSNNTGNAGCFSRPASGRRAATTAPAGPPARSTARSARGARAPWNRASSARDALQTEEIGTGSSGGREVYGYQTPAHGVHPQKTSRTPALPVNSSSFERRSSTARSARGAIW